MRIIIAIMIGAILAGCSIRSKSYYLLEGNKEIKKSRHLSKRVGIETIMLPRYFEQANVAIKEGTNRIIFLSSAHWVSDMNAHLTGVLIAYLKQRFATTDIYHYPWDVSKNVDTKVRIKIENFIYHDKAVHLDASWEISDKSDKKEAKFFHIKVPSTSDTDDIVKQMDNAFSKLEEAIAKSLS